MQVAKSNLVWKRESDEHKRLAKIFVRVSAALTVAFLVSGTYAVSKHAQFQDLCAALESRTHLQPLPSIRKINDEIIRDHCHL
jgi:hypothetical protein